MKMLGYFICFCVLLTGLTSEDALMVNVGTLLFLISFIFKCFTSKKIEDKIHPVVLYAVGKTMSTTGNILGMYYANDPVEKLKYWYYANETYLFEAAVIHAIGTIVLILGYEFYKKNSTNVLPQFYYPLPPNWLQKYDRIIWAFIIIIQFNIMPLPISKSMMNLSLSLFVFLYAYLSQKETNGNYYFFRAYILVIILTVNAYFNSYLRQETINPSILFFIGLGWGSGSLKPFRNLALIPVFLFLLIFSLSFNQLGSENARTNVQQKNVILISALENLLSFQFSKNENTSLDEEVDTHTIWGRMSNFNQVSKLVAIQKQDGFYYGETMAYMSYAWIPRILWPGKPMIAAGRWFAIRAGLAYVNDAGEPNNSVDMTQAGELYLNFGYFGAIAGCFLLGIFWSVLWQSANFFIPLNLTGIMYGGYLLNAGYTQFGADMQLVITGLSVYVTVFLIDKFLNLVFPTGQKNSISLN